MVLQGDSGTDFFLSVTSLGVKEYFAHDGGFSATHLKEHKRNANEASDHFLCDEANLPHVDG
jgi:hypothetical protein